MPGVVTATWQASLLDGDPGDGPSIAPGWVGLRRTDLGAGAWIEHVPRWVSGSDVLLERCLATLTWGQREEVIHGQRIAQPRLTARVRVGEVPAGLRILDDMAAALTARYRVVFETVGANHYRDGRDSVAWHGDRGHRERLTATIATVSLGHPRTFRLRPRQGGRSLGLTLGRGDLLVMGGTCQRTFQHAVPKVADAGTRVSLGFRHADPPRRLGARDPSDAATGSASAAGT